MIYKSYKELSLSALGMGCMRLPTREDGSIDKTATAEMVEYAIGKGINYFDTAWGYHGGESELVMGEVLQKYPREDFYLASKFPGYDLSNMDKVEQIFERQLEKCRVEYFDFYMFHNVCEMNVNEYLDEKYGIFEFLMEQKRKGKIRHLGFSTHGSLSTMEKFIKAYGSEMEFCQIQLNWLDWNFQNANAKVELLKKYDIPVWVMEPLRGGKLCSLEDKYVEQLNAFAPKRSLPEWAFRFILGIDTAVVTLSGMSNFEQLKENIDIFEDNRALSDKETDLLISIAKDMTSLGTVPCTSCRYCTDHCPNELDIPWLIELYNERVYKGGEFSTPGAFKFIPNDKLPSACIGCRSCEAVCPQTIKISEVLSDFASKIKT